MIEVTPITAITYTIIVTEILREHHVMMITHIYDVVSKQVVWQTGVSRRRCVRREVYAFELGVELLLPGSHCRSTTFRTQGRSYPFSTLSATCAQIKYYISYSRIFPSILNTICPVHGYSTTFRYSRMFLSILMIDRVLCMFTPCCMYGDNHTPCLP